MSYATNGAWNAIFKKHTHTVHINRNDLYVQILKDPRSFTLLSSSQNKVFAPQERFLDAYQFQCGEMFTIKKFTIEICYKYYN